MIVTLLSGCKKSNIIGGYGDAIGNVQIYYRDSIGRPLFTGGSNGYYNDSIAVYDLNNKPKRLISPSLWGFAPWGVSLFNIDNLGIQWTVINAYTKILIHLKSGVDDTLRGHYYNNDSQSNLYDSVWYNGVLKYNKVAISDTFTIVKYH